MDVSSFSKARVPAAPGQLVRGSSSSLSCVNDFAAVTARRSPPQQTPGGDIPRFVSGYDLSNHIARIWASTCAEQTTASNSKIASHMQRGPLRALPENPEARSLLFMANPICPPAAVNVPPLSVTSIAIQQSFDNQRLAQRGGLPYFNREAERISMQRQSSPRISPAEQPSSPFPPIPVPASVQTQRFTPMRALTQQTPSRLFAARLPTSAPSILKFSARYRGMRTEIKPVAEHLNPGENCGLWLTNLPPKVTTHQLLKDIRNVGRVWCSYINYPDGYIHQTAAAKIVFFTPEAARELISISQWPGLFIQDYRAIVVRNRTHYGGHPTAEGVSRVLIITGQDDFVNEATITKFFSDRFFFEVDKVTELIKADRRTVIEYKFGSYRNQAQMGKLSLEKDRPTGIEKVEFGADPCEVGDTMSSYGIAAERIRGRGC